MGEFSIDLDREPAADHNDWLLQLRASVAVDIAEGRQLDMVLNDLILAITGRIDRCSAVVITLDDDGCPRVRSSSTPPEINRLIHGIRRRAWFGAWSAAINRQTEVVVPEIAASSLYREHQAILIAHGLLGSRAIALRGRHNLVSGALGLFLNDARVLTDEELDVFDEVAELVALAIRRDQHIREFLDRIRHDALTGLENRDGLEDHLRASLANTREDSSVGLLFVDIDDLTLVNDSLGHTAGDTVIATTAGRIRDQLMRSDRVVRFGGDEFIVVLENIRSIADARAVAERIRSVIGEPIEVSGNTLTTTVSIGITLGRRGTPALQLIDEGHAAVVRAKQAGRGSTTEHDRVLDTGAGDRLDREQQLRQALDNGEFVVFWQPKVNLATGAIAGAEALVRWQHPEHGIIGPDQFIGTAERAGLIDELSDVILRRAIDEAASTFVSEQEDFSVAINLSATQLDRANMLDVITSALDAANLAPKHLIIELTESILANKSVAERLNELQSAGVRLAIDDFGTGYSSLAYVQQLPVGIVKIDRAFIDGLEADGSGAPILRAAVAMAHALDMVVTVEGVETTAQLSGLRSLNVDWAQGYLFAEPGPKDVLLQQLRSQSNW